MPMSQKQDRVVVITGASRGIGAACSQVFSEKGDHVFVLSRTCPQNNAATHFPVDLSNTEQARSAIETILQQVGRIDVLILNAGIGVSGSVEHTSVQDAQKQFDICYFGALRVLQPALPALRRSKGIVIFTSSVAAVASIPFQAHYSACKSAVNGLVMALRNELRHTGVRVCAVLPGDVKTGFTAARKKTETGSDVYPAMLRSVAKMEHDEQHGMEPMQIAKRFYTISEKNHPKPYYSVGFGYRVICVLLKLLPARLTCWILGFLYAR